VLNTGDILTAGATGNLVIDLEYSEAATAPPGRIQTAMAADEG
jgi:hypothetical protein